MVRTWRATGGDIRQVQRTLFASDGFMDPANVGARFKTPYRFVISAVRAGAVPVADTGPLADAMSQPGMPSVVEKQCQYEREWCGKYNGNAGIVVPARHRECARGPITLRQRNLRVNGAIP
jgi:hypothetical protein